MKSADSTKRSFFFVINIKWLLKRQYTKSQLSQKHYWEYFIITDRKCQFWILKIAFLADKGYLGNFELRKRWKYRELSGMRPDPISLWKNKCVPRNTKNLFFFLGFCLWNVFRWLFHYSTWMSCTSWSSSYLYFLPSWASTWIFVVW